MGGDKQKSKHLNKIVQKKTGTLFLGLPFFFNYYKKITLFKPSFSQFHKPIKDQMCLK